MVLIFVGVLVFLKHLLQQRQSLNDPLASMFKTVSAVGVMTA